ncbi:MAG: hypothetical protein ACXWC6_16930 [Ramlibacter sp.]
MNLKTATVPAALALALAACGGGGGGGMPATVSGGPSDIASGSGNDSVPSTVFQGTDAFIAYLAQLIVAQGDTSEPLALPDMAAPTSDTTEPSGG